MVRTMGVAWVIMGLILQPLMAAVPDFVPADRSEQSALASLPTLDTPCHDAAEAEVELEPCADCGSKCADSGCFSTCSASTLVILSGALFNSSRPTDRLVPEKNGIPAQTPPAKIFHPPKHA